MSDDHLTNAEYNADLINRAERAEQLWSNAEADVINLKAKLEQAERALLRVRGCNCVRSLLGHHEGTVRCRLCNVEVFYVALSQLEGEPHKLSEEDR